MAFGTSHAIAEFLPNVRTSQHNSFEPWKNRLWQDIFDYAIIRPSNEIPHVNHHLQVKAVILAGGLGTRISEETSVRPKPMIEIGGRPILWHIMKIYSTHGVDDFIICLGYKGYVIKEYFANYFLHMSDVTFDMTKNKMEVHQANAEPWRVTLVDTGEATMTGGRLKRVSSYVEDGDFCLTYGDGLSNIDIRRLIAFHKDQGTLATVTAGQPPGRFAPPDVQQHKTT